MTNAAFTVVNGSLAPVLVCARCGLMIGFLHDPPLEELVVTATKHRCVGR